MLGTLCGRMRGKSTRCGQTGGHRHVDNYAVGMTSAASRDSQPADLSSGIRVTDLDPEVRPQDDLYLHVDGRWLERTEIPADKSRYGAFLQLAEAAEDAIRTIIEADAEADANADDASTADRRKIGDLYASFMDEDRAEQLGAAPIADDIAAALAPQTVTEFVTAVGRAEERGSSGFFGLYVDNDPGQPDRYVPFVMQGGIGLPDESYYREEQFADVRGKYLIYLQVLLELAGVDAAAERARDVLQLETDIAAAHWDVVASREIEKTYNLRTFDQLVAATPNIDWSAYLEAAQVDPKVLAEVVVAQPSALEGLAALLTEDRLPAWRSWLAVNVIRGAAPYLSHDFVEINFDFYGRTLSGTPELRPRWKRGVSLVQGGLGEAVGREYVAQHFPPAAKHRMDELVANLIEAYRRSVDSLTWLGDDTKRLALEKLAKFTPKIGYPVKWRDYSTLEIDRDDLVGNVRAIGRYEQARELGKIGRPIDRDEWFMTPQTVNAYYNPGFNEIVFPAAILQPPFFNAEADDAANYGGIGAVIGHEISHGFDDQGSKYDGDGRLVDWWSATDREAFERLTAALVAQYSALEPLDAPGHKVNGALTLGENIADLSGLSIAWQAYLLSLGVDPAQSAADAVAEAARQAPVIDDLTGPQRFFLSWAQVWAEKRRPEEAVRLLTIDPHSPNDLRANQIPRNLDAFHEVFSVAADDRLWLGSDERVRIW